MRTFIACCGAWRKVMAEILATRLSASDEGGSRFANGDSRFTNGDSGLSSGDDVGDEGRSSTSSRRHPRRNSFVRLHGRDALVRALLRAALRALRSVGLRAQQQRQHAVLISCGTSCRAAAQGSARVATRR